MESSRPARVLVVAHRTAATPQLLEAIRERAEAGPAEFTLLVPRMPTGLHRVVDPEDSGDTEAQMVLELALPLLEEAAGGPVEGRVGDSNPSDAVHDVMYAEHFDEIIISTLPARVSRWLRADLPSKLKPLGVPITTVVAKSRAAARTQAAARE